MRLSILSRARFTAALILAILILTMRPAGAQTLTLQRTISGFETAVYGVAFSRDGRFIVTTDDLATRVWDAHSGESKRHWPEVQGRSLALSADNRTLVVGGYQGTVQVVDFATGDVRGTFKLHTSIVPAVSLSPDGKQVLSSSWDGKILLWDAATGEVLHTLKSDERVVHTTALAPDGQTIATANWRHLNEQENFIQVQLWDAATGNLKRTMPESVMPGPATTMAFSPDGKVLAVGGSAAPNTGPDLKPGIVRLWDTATGQLKETFIRDSGGVSSLAFSPDGTTVAGGGYDCAIALWDVPSGTLRRTLARDNGPVNVVAFAPDGATIVAGGLAPAGERGLANVWDVQSGAWQLGLAGPGGWVNAVTVARDGRTFAAGDQQGAVVILDGAGAEQQEGRWRRTLHMPPSRIDFIVFSPDDKTLATSGNGNTIKLWEATDPGDLKLKRVLVAPDAPDAAKPQSVVFAPDGKTLASAGGESSIRLWDVATGVLRATLNAAGPPLTQIAFSPDGQTVAATSGGQTVALWDVATQTVRHTLAGLPGATSSTKNVAFGAVAFAPDGATVAGTSGHTIALWNTRTGALQKTLKIEHWTNDLAFTASGKTLVGGGAGWNPVRLWDIETGHSEVLPALQRSVWRLQLAPDRSTLAAFVQGTGSTEDNRVILWDLKADSVKQVLRADGSAMGFSHDGKTLVCPGHGDNSALRVWNLATGKVAPRQTADDEGITALALSPDGRMAATATADGTVNVWNTASGRLERVLPGPTRSRYPCVLAFSPDGETLAAARGGMVTLWDARTWTVQAALEGYTRETHSIAFAPAGKTLALGGYMTKPGDVGHVEIGVIELWDPQTGQLERTLTDRKNGAVESLAFSADGKTLGAGIGSVIQLRDVVTGAILATLQGHTLGVNALSFAPDGQTLASTSWDNTLRLWDIASGTLLQTLTPHGDRITGAVFSPATTTLVSGGHDKTLKVWRLSPRENGMP